MSNQDHPSFKLALIQLTVEGEKTRNLANAARLIKEAAQNGAELVALPECFNSPYGIEYLEKNAESIPGGETTATLSEQAKQLGIFIVGGSIPERYDNALYNTCTVWNPQGDMVTSFRKMHLFDMDMPGVGTFFESKIFRPGSSLASFDTPFCRVGLGICHDIRFPELAQLYAEQGCQLLLFPSAFNMTTGAVHWELVQRARAVDNQVYVGAVSPARDSRASYVTWGHSSVISPWGEVIAATDEKESIVYADIGNTTFSNDPSEPNIISVLLKDLGYLQRVRAQFPLFKQKRYDLYVLKTI